MKQKLTLTLALLGVCSAAHAAVINCLPAEQQNVTGAVSTGAQTFTCGTGAGNLSPIGTNGDGTFLTNLRLGLSGIISDNNATNGSTYSVTFTGQNVTGAFTIPNWNLIVSGTPTGPNSLGLFTVGANGTQSSATDSGSFDSLASFTVSVTGVVTPGNTIPQSASSSLVFTYDERSAVPEPSTYAMVGTAITALAFVARRRRA